MALQSLRNAAQSWIFKGLLIVLAFTFAAFFGVSGDPFSRSTALIAVGDVEIDSQTLLREFNQQVQRISQMLNQQISTEQAQRLGLLDETVERLVMQAVLDEAARDFGLVASDPLIARTITESPQFRPTGGAFDRFTFETFLRMEGYSEASFADRLRRQIVQQQLLQAAATGAVAPRAAVELLYRYRNEKRTALVATLKGDPEGEEAAPDDVAVQAYYDANRTRYMAPELRSGVIAFLTPEKFAQEITVSDADAEAAYRSQRSRFETPERRKLLQAVLPSDKKEDADRLIKLVADGKPFAEAAKEVTGADPVDLGEVTRDAIALEALAEAAFKAPAGGVGEPAQSALGWHVVHVVEVTPGTSRSLDEARDELKREIAVGRARDTMFEIADAVEDALAGGARIEQVAEAHRLDLLPIAAIARDGTNGEGVAVTGLPSQRTIVPAFFASPVGRDSDLGELTEGGFYILRVDKTTPPAQKPLEAVRADVEKAWQAEQRRTRAEAAAKALVARIEAGADFTEAATEAKAELKETQPFARGGAGAGLQLGGDLAARLFRAQPNEVVMAPFSEGYQVARLLTVEKADPATGEAELNRVGDTLRTGIGEALQLELAESLRAAVSVEIDRAAIDRLFAQ